MNKKVRNYTVKKMQKPTKMDDKEVIDLCSESQTMTSDHWRAKQNKNKETMTQRRAKQLLERQMKTGLKRTFKPQK